MPTFPFIALGSQCGAGMFERNDPGSGVLMRLPLLLQFQSGRFQLSLKLAQFRIEFRLWTVDETGAGLLPITILTMDMPIPAHKFRAATDAFPQLTVT